MSKNIQIPLKNERLGLTYIDETIIKKLNKGLRENNGELTSAIAAVLTTHRPENETKASTEEHFEQVKMEIIREGQTAIVNCSNIPIISLYDNHNITKSQENLVSDVLRDLILYADNNHKTIGESITKKIRERCGRAGLFADDQDPRVRVFVQGGHRITEEEKKICRKYAEWEARINQVELITGCGSGVMEHALYGALRGYISQGIIQNRTFIGFTEKGILAMEPPNPIVQKLITFPNIEQRMEAFIRCSHRGIIMPGGVGTTEELLTILGIKLQKDNAYYFKENPYPIDIIEKKSKQFTKAIKKFLTSCFGKTIIEENLSFSRYNPQDHANNNREKNQEIIEKNRINNTFSLFNDRIKFDAIWQEPFNTTFEAIENLDLSTDQPISMLMANLRRFFSAVVDLTVRNPEKVAEWNSELPLLRGSKPILDATNELMQTFIAQKRMAASTEKIKIYRT